MGKKQKSRKCYYATVFSGEALIWRSWPKCKTFCDSHPGFNMKGFYNLIDAKKWIGDFDADLVMENPWDLWWASLDNERELEDEKNRIPEFDEIVVLVNALNSAVDRLKNALQNRGY